MSKKRDEKQKAPDWPDWLLMQSGWTDSMESLCKESDRAVALISAAYLDDALEQVLAAHFVGGKSVIQSLFDSPNAPLGTFSSRVLMAHAMGLVDVRTFGSLEAIRKIRNKFAHLSSQFDFDDPTVKGLISTLELPCVLPDPLPDLSTMRNRFIWSTAAVLAELSRALKAAKRPPANT